MHGRQLMTVLLALYSGKIVEGRVQKTIARGALLEQPFIRDTAKVHHRSGWQPAQCGGCT